jgi:hypothetical protein
MTLSPSDRAVRVSFGIRCPTASVLRRLLFRTLILTRGPLEAPCPRDDFRRFCSDLEVIIAHFFAFGSDGDFPFVKTPSRFDKLAAYLAIRYRLNGLNACARRGSLQENFARSNRNMPVQKRNTKTIQRVVLLRTEANSVNSASSRSERAQRR